MAEKWRQSKEARVRTKYPLVPDVVFGFHDDDEVGPRMLARIAKRTGLKPEDL